MTRHSAGAVGAAALLVLAVGPARAQAPHSCFEIVPAQAGVQPAILIDKCSGRTWQLARGRRGAFRWTGLSRDDGATATAAATAPATGASKCFTFEGRKFCE